MSPIKVEVIAPVPEGWGLCQTCEVVISSANLGAPPYERTQGEYPAEWMDDFERLSALITDLAARHGDKIIIILWDPRSLQGMLKSICHRVRHYPTFVIGGHEKVEGLEKYRIEQAIEAYQSNT